MKSKAQVYEVDSGSDLSPSELQCKKQFEKGIRAMKADRGDSLDSVNAIKLKQLLDGDSASFISKVSRNLSAAHRKDDKVEKMTSSLSDKTRSDIQKSARGPGTVITKASKAPTSMTKSKT